MDTTKLQQSLRQLGIRWESSSRPGFINKMQFSKAKQADFLRAIASPMKVGRSIYDISKHISRYGEPVHRKIASKILTELQIGNAINPVSSSLKGWIDEISLSALSAAESNGPQTLIYALETIAESLEQSSQSYAAMFAMSAYPLVLNIVAVGVLFFATAPVVELYKELIDNAPDPILDRFGNVIFFYQYIFPILTVLLIGGFLYLIYYMKNDTSDLRLTLDKYPVFNLYRLNAGSKIISTYALLKRFGMPPLKILGIIRSSGGRYQKHHCNLMINSHQEGDAINETMALDTGLLDNQHIALLYLYVSGNEDNFNDAMKAASKAIDLDISKQMKAFSKIISLSLFVLLIFNIMQIVSVQYGFNIRDHL